MGLSIPLYELVRGHHVVGVILGVLVVAKVENLDCSWRTIS